MPIVVSAGSGGGTFTPHPEGSFGAVCVDVYDCGMVETQWGTKHKIEVYFFCGLWTEPNDQGEKYPMLVRSRFTATLDERGNLRAFLEKWRGKKFTEAELKGFDVESLIGAPAFLQVSHNVSGEKTYANIDAALRLPQGMTAPTPPADFKRRHIRDAERGAENSPTTPEPTEQVPASPFANDDDDLPF